MVNTESYHASNLGSAGSGVTTDQAGYVHLTADSWMDAPMDWGTDWADASDEDRLAECEELAAESRAATAAAEAGIAAWGDER